MTYIPTTVKAQAARFLRLFLIALVPQLFALQGDHITRSLLIALVVGSLEVAWRQFVAPPEAGK